MIINVSANDSDYKRGGIRINTWNSIFISLFASLQGEYVF